jgi:hypothetical protein
MRLSGPDPFLRIETRGNGLFGRHFFLPTVHRSEDSPRFFVGCHFFGTTDELELSEADTNRLFCLALIQHLPDDALAEAAESLAAIYEFHQLPRARPPVLAVSETIPARITGTYVRPVFPIREE